MLSFYLKYVGGNIFINTFGVGISNFLANLSASLMQKKIGTRWSMVVNISIALTFGIPLLFDLPPWAIAM